MSPLRESRQQMRRGGGGGKEARLVGAIPEDELYAWERPTLRRTDLPFSSASEEIRRAQRSSADAAEVELAYQGQERSERSGVGSSDSLSKMDRARMLRREVARSAEREWGPPGRAHIRRTGSAVGQEEAGCGSGGRNQHAQDTAFLVRHCSLTACFVGRPRCVV